MAPSAAPTPIPAFAPVDRPPFAAAGAELEPGGAVFVVDAAGGKMDVDTEGVGAGVGMGSPKCFASVYTDSPLPSTQQA